MTLWERCADESDRQVVLRSHRQRDIAKYAGENWRIETAALIEAEAQNFFTRGHGRWVLMPRFPAGTTVQIDLHTDVLLPKKLGSTRLAPEGSASLVFSLHPNGSVAVIASPHSSVHTSKESRGYIIDLVPHVWSLAGIAGRERVRRHFRTFGRLAALTRSDALPTRSDGWFLRRLVERGEMFASAFESSRDARRHRLSQEANFGIGLVAGLIASTIWPFAKDVGEAAGDRATATMERCEKAFASGPRLHSCLSDGAYRLDRSLDSVLSAEVLLALALLVTLLVLWNLVRIKQQR